jgi:hypothetical protein
MTPIDEFKLRKQNRFPFLFVYKLTKNNSLKNIIEKSSLIYINDAEISKIEILPNYPYNK